VTAIDVQIKLVVVVVVVVVVIFGPSFSFERTASQQ
jgi:uncharacterized membrane protein YqiK